MFWRFARIATAVTLLVFIFWWIDIRLVLETMKKISPWYSMFILALLLSDRYLMAYKWALLIRARGSTLSTLEAFRIYLASGFVGTFLPSGVGGDVFRAIRTTVGGRKSDIVTATIVIERVLGVLAVTVLSLVGWTIVMYVEGHRFQGLYSTIWLAFVVIFGSLLVSIHPVSFRLTRRLLKPFDRYKPVQFLFDFHTAYLEFRHSPRVLASFFFLSLCDHLIISLTVYVAANALSVSSPFLYFLALVPLATFASFIPVSLGGLGVDEGVYIFLLRFAGLAPAESLSIILLLRILGWLMLIPGGLVVWQDSLKIRQAQAKL